MAERKEDDCFRVLDSEGFDSEGLGSEGLGSEGLPSGSSTPRDLAPRDSTPRDSPPRDSTDSPGIDGIEGQVCLPSPELETQDLSRKIFRWRSSTPLTGR